MKKTRNKPTKGGGLSIWVWSILGVLVVGPLVKSCVKKITDSKIKSYQNLKEAEQNVIEDKANEIIELPQKELFDLEQDLSWTEIKQIESAEEQYLFAVKCYNGNGTSSNYRRAAYWLKKAANQGHPQAAHDLAVMHEKSLGVNLDYNISFNLHNLAANKGYAPSIYKKGVYYSQGLHVKKDIKKAEELYKLAFDSLSADIDSLDEFSLYSLGKYYQYGIGTVTNTELAIKLYELAGMQGQSAAQEALYLIYGHDENGHKNKEKFKFWKQKYFNDALEKANSSIAADQFIVASCYYFGRGVESNHRTSLLWYQKSANNGLADAQYMLANWYKLGHIVKKDSQKSTKWMIEAYKSGMLRAKQEINQ